LTRVIDNLNINLQSVLNDHEEWIEEKIKPALLLTAERLKEGLEKSLKKITKRYNRLIELRYEKMTQPLMEEDPTNLEESMSVYSSEASSMASGYSSISSTSSRLSTTSSQMSRGSKCVIVIKIVFFGLANSLFVQPKQ
jgi:hypothetical protein